MPPSATGLVFSLVAIVSWGTALVPLKLQSVKENGVMFTTLMLSMSYLLAAACSAIVLWCLGEQAWASTGLIGGVLWGVGKILVIRAVSGTAGLAAAQAVQCVCNIIAAFLAGVLIIGEPASAVSAIAVTALALGLVGIVVPLPRQCLAVTSAASKMDPESLLEASQGRGASAASETEVGQASSSKYARFFSLAMAASAGVMFGFQSVPYTLDESKPSTWGYAVAIGVGQFAVIASVCVPVTVRERARVLAAFSGEAEAIPPLVSRWDGVWKAAGGGVLLFAAAACSTAAVKSMGLSVAQPLAQHNMVVAGCWGIFAFGEVKSLLDRVRFFAGCVIAVGGAALLQL